jgi:predicted nucleic acid-binding protein
VVSWYLDRDARTRYPGLVQWLEHEIRRDGLHISSVTIYELKRGVAELLLRGEGTRKAARIERIVREAAVHGLDANDNLGWKVAADIWAKARASGEALSEGDLLITATAIAHGRSLVTVDDKLRTQLTRLSMNSVLHDAPIT